MIYIIDGYNVMHFAAQGAGIEASDLEEKRRMLIEGAVSHSAFTGAETIVVFDAKQAKSPQRHRINGTQVTVIFASSSESADIIIGKLINEHLSRQTGDIRVVSADWEVQKGSLQARVERITPRQYLSEEKNFEKGVANSKKMDRIRWKIEHKLDLETLQKLEELRRGKE